VVILYHFTCDDHGAPGIEANGGVIVPRYQDYLGLSLVWMTNDRHASRDDLGLSARVLLTCDRMANRFAIEAPVDAVPWLSIRSRMPRASVVALEGVRGTRPSAWFVSRAVQKGRRDD
jgi:hypothetical protein